MLVEKENVKEKILNFIKDPLKSLIFILLIFSLLQSIINQITIINGVLFFCFEVFVILLPGFCLISILDLKRISKTAYVGLSFACGYVFNIILYYVINLLHLNSLYHLIILVYLLSTFFIFYKYKKIDYSQLEFENKEAFICFAFMIIILIMQQIVFSANNALPTIVHSNTYYSDLLYWVGDAIELGMGYPPQEFRFIHMDYNYHFFSAMQLSVIAETTTIPYIHVGLIFSYIQPIILLVFSAYSMFKNFTKKYSYLVLALIALFFTAGNENFTYVTYISHIWKAPFGFDVGMAFSMLSISFFIKQTFVKKFNLSYLLISILSYFCCLGSKGPIGMITILFIGIVCLYKFLAHKEYKTYLIWGLSFLLIFATLYFFVLSSRTNSNFNAANRVNFDFTSLEGLWNATGPAPLYQKLTNGNLPIRLGQIIYILYFFISCNYLYFILFIFYLVLIFFRKLKITILDFSMIIVIIISYLCMMFMNANGRSQLYFLIAAYPLIILFDFKMTIILKSRISYKKNIFLNLALIFLFETSLIFFSNNQWHRESLRHGLANYNLIEEEPIYSDALHYMNKEMYNAYLWVRENTTEDAYLLCDNVIGHYEKDKRASYIPGAITERHVWQNDLNIILQIMTNDFSKLNALKTEGVNYIIQTKWLSPYFLLPESEGIIVYENSEVSIYKLN